MEKKQKLNPAKRRPVKRRRRRRRRNPLLRFLKVAGIAVMALAVVVIAAVLFMDMEMQEKQPEMRYPMDYMDIIRENAYMQGIEPEYVSAIILAESAYNPNAVSSVNAQGLMQIMPDTGAWLAGKFDEEYWEGCLFVPEINIRYGCWYLGYLNRRFDGDKVCVTAAYHSGQGKVDEWLANPAYSADGKTLHAMGGSNATTYVDRVMRYYEKYLEIYAGEAA